jgi:hypothetical protein
MDFMNGGSSRLLSYLRSLTIKRNAIDAIAYFEPGGDFQTRGTCYSALFHLILIFALWTK